MSASAGPTPVQSACPSDTGQKEMVRAQTQAGEKTAQSEERNCCRVRAGAVSLAAVPGQLGSWQGSPCSRAHSSDTVSVSLDFCTCVDINLPCPEPPATPWKSTNSTKSVNSTWCSASTSFPWHGQGGPGREIHESSLVEVPNQLLPLQSLA